MFDSKIVTLLALVNAGSFTQAARDLNLTQPAVSHHIHALEEQYGISIFYKDRKRLRPTPEGEILIKYARRASALADTVKKELEDSRKHIKSLVIGITPTAQETFVPHVLASYCDQHPSVHINIVSDTINNLYTMLESYELDVAVVEGVTPDNHFTSVLLDTDHLCLVVSPQHRLAHRKSITLQELKTLNFILRPANAGTRSLFENHLLRHSESIQSLNIMMEIDNVSIIKELVASNLGATIISHMACRADLTSGALVEVPIENMSMVREINMVYSTSFSHKEIIDDIRRLYSTKSL